MKGIKSLKLGLVGIAAGAFLVAGSLLLVGQAFAIPGNVRISSGVAAPNEHATVELSVQVGDPGLGAWTIDIGYDPELVSVVSCDPDFGGVCNPEYGPDVIRVTGASASGEQGNPVLAAIEFECGDEEGRSQLTLAVEVLADATVGDPQDIDETLNEGAVTCAVPEPTATGVPAGETPTALPTIVSTGLGGGNGTGGSSTDLSWLIASLAGLGVIALAGYGVLRVRTRSW